MNESAATRDRLLAAARRLFAERGIASASVRAITHAANANLGAITYHFGSKDRLRDAVLDQLYGSFVDRVAAAAAPTPPGRAPERIARMVHAIFAYFAENPDTPRILIQVLAASAKDPYPAAIVAQQRRLLQTMTAVVQDGIAAGELRPVHPVLVAFTIMSQSVWFAIVRQQIAAMSGVPFDRPEMASAVEHHIIEVVARALAP